MTKKIFSMALSALLVCVLFVTGKEVHALHEGFTATELADTQNITVDGTKDAAWDSATAFSLDTVRQYNLNGGANNPNPATGQISVMYNSSKLYLFAEITDSTKLSTVSAWDPFNILEYDSYKYNADYLNIQLDIKHNNPTDYGQGWGASYNDGKDVAAHFELAAGAGELTYSANGSTGWVYDTSNELFTLSEYATTHSTIYSVATETGYTFEMVIDLSEAGVTDFAAGKTIGLYVGYWDRYDSCGGSWGEQSLTTTAFEWNNYEPWKGPGWLPEVTFVGSSVSGDDNGETPEPTPTVPTATQTHETIGAADGVKDDAYNAATVIPVTHVAWESENPTPATANMYLLWDASYLYVFVEVTDETYYGYQEGAWLETRDALEMIVDLYHNTSYTGGYGGDYRGDKMCEGYYKIAAGVGAASVDSTVQGTHWMWDDQKNNGSYASALTETGYTVEYKIALGKDAAEYMVADREIGVGVKIYDKHADDKDTSKTVLEGKNDGQHEKPANLSTVKLVGTEKPVEPDPVVPSGFTATDLGNLPISVDGVKDAAWTCANPISVDQVRKLYLFNSAKSNANPATGNVSVMFTGNKLYIFAEVTDSTRDMNNMSAWDAYGLNSYNSYKYHADHLDIYLDIKHDDPTNYGQAWGSAYNNGKDVAGHFELAAGAGNLTYSADGSTGWLYEPFADGQFSLAQYAVNHSTMYSVATETGYTFEMVIDLSEAGIADFLVGKTIGLYVGYYDRYETSDAAGNWGEQSVTTTSFAFNNYEPWNGPGWLPEVTFVANTATEGLDEVKSAAKAELEAYKSADLYRPAEKDALAAAIEAGKTAIDGAISEADLENILAAAKAEIDLIKTAAQLDAEEAIQALADAKTAAKAEIESYKSVDDYRTAEGVTYLTVVDNAKTAIDGAESIEDVNAVLATAKTAIDSIKTKAQYEAEEQAAAEAEAAKALADAKTAAKAELDSYKSLEGLSDEQKAEVASKITEGKAAIDAATSTDAVASALAAAKAELDAITPIPAPANTGCFGSVTATVFAMFALFAFVLVLRKKKELVK